MERRKYLESKYTGIKTLIILPISHIININFQMRMIFVLFFSISEVCYIVVNDYSWINNYFFLLHWNYYTDPHVYIDWNYVS